MSPVLAPKVSIAVTTTPRSVTGVPGAIESSWTIWIVTEAPLEPVSPPGLPSVLLLLSLRHATIARPRVEKARNEEMRMRTCLPRVCPRFRYIERARLYTENAKPAMRRASQHCVKLSSRRRGASAAARVRAVRCGVAPEALCLRGLRREPDELDERHRRRVALAGARLEQARVAALAGGE